LNVLKKTKACIALVGLLTFLVLGVLNFQGVVLCLEPDGRMTLETSVNGNCNDSWQEANQAKSHALKTVEALHVKQCTDIPVSLADAKPQEVSSLDFSGFFQGLAPSQAFQMIPAILKVVTENHFANPPPFLPLLHRVLSSIILLL
jgi:hypothetical protein